MLGTVRLSRSEGLEGEETSRGVIYGSATYKSLLDLLARHETQRWFCVKVAQALHI